MARANERHRRLPAHIWLSRITLASGCAFLAVMAAAVWMRPKINPIRIAEAMAGVNLVLFLAAALVFRREKAGVRGVRLFLIFSVAGTTGIGVIAAVRDYFRVPIGTGELLLALAFVSSLCIYFGSVSAFADFRFADIFVRRSLRVAIAGIFGLAACFGLAAFRGRLPGEGANDMAITVAVAAATLLSPGLDDLIGTLVHRWIFRQPDDAATARSLWEVLISVGTKEEVFAAAERICCSTLELGAARVLPRDQVPGEHPQLDLSGGVAAEILSVSAETAGSGVLPGFRSAVVVPVQVRGVTSYVLAVEPGSRRPVLRTGDAAFLRTVAAQVSSRLDGLAFEEERMNRERDAARLQQQLLEAELRALRAQVNPHFLSNSLNAIADLTATNPAGAETMIVRLANTFRRLLLHANRADNTVEEELAFLRDYLSIEEVRFGPRLQVAIEADGDVLQELVPSLILQPLVENSIRHGLAPKPGPGHLKLQARISGPDIELVVEDDGIGRGTRQKSAYGVGLRNVAERLKTLHAGNAALHFEYLQPSGARVTLRMPRTQVREASA
jgi:two-component system LytT family sensor kinase